MLRFFITDTTAWCGQAFAQSWKPIRSASGRSAGNGKDAIDKANELKPDIAIIDYPLPHERDLCVRSSRHPKTA